MLAGGSYLAHPSTLRDSTVAERHSRPPLLAITSADIFEPSFAHRFLFSWSSVMRSTFLGRVSPSVLMSCLACGCGLLAVTGCSESKRPLGELIPVKGKVLVDGTPVTEGTVTFVPFDKDSDLPTPGAKIQADGTYTLTTDGQPGAPEGKYRVRIEPGASSMKAKLQIKPIYSGKRSPLTLEVAKNRPDGDYDLNLDPRKAP